MDSSVSTIRQVAIANIFKLFEKFAVSKNKIAPKIYTTCVLQLVGNSNVETRENYLSQFKHIFKNYRAIPIKIMVDPLINMYSTV